MCMRMYMFIHMCYFRYAINILIDIIIIIMMIKIAFMCIAIYYIINNSMIMIK